MKNDYDWDTTPWWGKLIMIIVWIASVLGALIGLGISGFVLKLFWSAFLAGWSIL